MLFPLTYLLIFLWGLIGKVSNKDKGQSNTDFFYQFLFVSAATTITLLIDYFILPYIFPYLPELLPQGVVRFVLFPITFAILAKIIGPSKEIKIDIRNEGKLRRR